jgi:hypothetical protein
MQPITAAEYLQRFGVAPEQDDLDRVNCDRAGAVGHSTCGVCPMHKHPRFMCPAQCLLDMANRPR